ncbi:40S ribosomal protein S5-1 [Hordeum vulgare]|nr:40S ribosomal protein S5-1 [Hordeum vulgare]
MHEGVLHIRDVEGPKKTRSMEVWLEAMEQQVLKCQGMVERGLNANHMMITEFTKKHKINANDIGKHLSRLYDRIDHLQAQIYDLQNQNSPELAVVSTVIPDLPWRHLRAHRPRPRRPVPSPSPESPWNSAHVHARAAAAVEPSPESTIAGNPL